MSIASLGHFLYKVRIATKGRGKRSSARTIIAYQKDDKAFFIYGYAKNEKDNIDATTKEALVKLAQLMLSFTSEELRYAVRNGKIKEVRDVQET